MNCLNGDIHSQSCLTFGNNKLLVQKIMPSSPLYTITSIMAAVAEIMPKSVLDLGMGFGKFGFLIRAYFDLRPGKRGGYDRWKMRIDGIEIFKEYITDVHKYIYDDIFIGDAVDILSEKNLYYDMVIGVDILEHFTRKDGYTFIERAKSVSNNVFNRTSKMIKKTFCWLNRHSQK